MAGRSGLAACLPCMAASSWSRQGARWGACRRASERQAARVLTVACAGGTSQRPLHRVSDTAGVHWLYS